MAEILVVKKVKFGGLVVKEEIVSQPRSTGRRSLTRLTSTVTERRDVCHRKERNKQLQLSPACWPGCRCEAGQPSAGQGWPGPPPRPLRPPPPSSSSPLPSSRSSSSSASSQAGLSTAHQLTVKPSKPMLYNQCELDKKVMVATPAQCTACCTTAGPTGRSATLAGTPTPSSSHPAVAGRPGPGRGRRTGPGQSRMVCLMM